MGTRQGRWGNSYLLGGSLDKINPAVELAQFMVTSRGIGEDLDAIKAHENVRAMEAN